MTVADRDPAFAWRFTVPLYLGSALNPVNSSLVATALVPIARGLDVPVGRTAGLVAGLYLACVVAQPTAGRAAELLGPRRVFLAGIALVGVGGLVGGVAPDLPTLVVSRVLIGAGTSCAYPTAMVMVRQRADAAGLDDPPGAVLGGLQVAGTVTASLGLPVGGLLVAAFGWRSVFLVNVPVAVLTLLAARAWLPADPSLREGRGPRRVLETVRRLDLVGIVGFSTAMLTLLLFAFSLPGPTWLLLALSVVLWAGVVAWELHVDDPFLDVRLLASAHALTRTYARFALLLLCNYLVLYGVTQWLQGVRGVSEGAAGLLLLPMTLVSGLVVVPFARRNLVWSPAVLAAVGCVLGSAGVLLLSTSAWIGWVVGITLVFGVVMGAAAAGNQTALYGQAPPDRLGTAAGLLRSSGYVGSIASSAVTAVVDRGGVTDGGVHRVGVVMVTISAALLVLTLADRGLRRLPARPSAVGERS